MIQGKVWGWTMPVWAGNNVEVHYIHGFAGGYCSRHSHAHKSNLFCVLSGVLRVEQWPIGATQDAPPDVSELRPGESCEVPPGVSHRFVASEDCSALEIYWTTLDAADIIRESPGGRQKKGTA